MGRRQKRFWLPLTRLSAGFVAVVVVGNVVLHAFRPDAADLATPDAVDATYFAKKKKRIEKQFFRAFEKLLGPPAVAPAKEKISTIPLDQAPAQSLGIVPAVEPIAAAPAAPIIKAPEPRPAAALGFIEPEPAPFVWPAPLPPLPHRPFDLPVAMSLIEETRFRADLVSEWSRRGERDIVADIGDTILKGPELLLDGVFTCASGLGTRRPVRLWEDDDQRSMMSQIMDIEMGPRKQRIWQEFMTQWTQREAKYVSNFGDSRANTAGFEDGRSEADMREFALDQRKVFWDALRRTYLARYKVHAEEKIREEAWYLDRWSGADFVILPPMLAGYVFYRGLDRRFNVLGTKVTFSVEPVSEWYRANKRDLPAMIAMEWSMKHCPFGVIVSAGLHDGRYGLDFIGIGSSVGAVRRALAMQEERR
jgi:hypothetical protein